MPRNRFPQRIGLTLAILLLILALAIPIVLYVNIGGESFEITCSPLIKDPKIGFVDFTSMEWPKNAEVITFGDTRSGMLCEGKSYLIFKADQEILKNGYQKPHLGDLMIGKLAHFHSKLDLTLRLEKVI